MSEGPEILMKIDVRVADFSRELASWMKACLKSGGVPTFRSKFRSLEFRESLLGVCYAPATKIESVLFKDVPPEVITEIKTRSPDWVYLAERFGDEELREFVRRLRSL